MQRWLHRSPPAEKGRLQPLKDAAAVQPPKEAAAQPQPTAAAPPTAASPPGPAPPAPVAWASAPRSPRSAGAAKSPAPKAVQAETSLPKARTSRPAEKATPALRSAAAPTDEVDLWAADVKSDSEPDEPKVPVSPKLAAGDGRKRGRGAAKPESAELQPASPAAEKRVKRPSPRSSEVAGRGSPAPEAAHLVLSGLKIVVTGVLKNIDRDAAERHIKALGGQVTSAVSGRTDILVYGPVLEDGRPTTSGKKYQRAVELQTATGRARNPNLRLIPGEEFFAKYPLGSGGADAGDDPDFSENGPLPSEGAGASPATAGRKGVKVSSALGAALAAAAAAASPAAAGAAPAAAPGAAASGASGDIWTEKWRPQTPEELVGNGEVIRKLRLWLENWDDVCLRGRPPPVAAKKAVGRFAEPERVSSSKVEGNHSILGVSADFNVPLKYNMKIAAESGKSVSASRLHPLPQWNARAAMLSGPPGIGKTTAALVVARACGYRPIEMNASDERNKGAVDRLGDMVLGGQGIRTFLITKPAAGGGSAGGGVGLPPPGGRKPLVIMDEMDGLSAGDRGGAQALAKLIESAKCPIICICNDRLSPKVRAVSSRCFELRFARPQKNVMAKRLCRIAAAEKLTLEYNAAELLCERAGNDFRSVLNVLQVLSKDRASVTYTKCAGNSAARVSKDAQGIANAFDVTRKLLTRAESRGVSLGDRQELFFVDYDLLPLLIQENCLAAALNAGGGGGAKETEAMQREMAAAMDSFVQGDVTSRCIMRENDWSLLPAVAFATCVYPTAKMAGFTMRVDFPKWLGKNSTATRNRRYLSETSLFLSRITSTSTSALVADGYLNAVYDDCLKPLLGDSSKDEAVDACIYKLQEYDLTRTVLLENIASLRLKAQDDKFALVDSGTKRAFTTSWNARGIDSRMAAAGAKGVVKKTRKKGFGPTLETQPVDVEGGVAREVAAASSDEDNAASSEDDLDRLLVKKAKATKAKKIVAATAKPKAKAKARARKTPA